MACCVAGLAITVAAVWAARFVRVRILRRSPGIDPAAWRPESLAAGETRRW